MTAKISTYAADLVLGVVRGGTLTYDVSGNVLVLTADQPDDNAYTKITGSGYADLALLTTDWSTPVSRVTYITTEKDFPEVTTPGGYAAVGYAIEDSSANTLFSGSLSQGIPPVAIGDLIGTNTNSFGISMVTDSLGDYFAHAILSALLKGESLGALPYTKLKFTGSNGSVLGLTPIQIPADTSNWSAPSGRSITNLLVLESEIATQDYEIYGWQLTNDEDDVMWQEEFTSVKSLATGRKLRLAAGSITLSA